MDMNKVRRRNIMVVAVVICVFVGFAANLFRIQIVNAEDSGEKVVTAATVTVEAARGEIYDRNGKVLVTNRQSNSVVFESGYFPSQNEMEKRIEIIDSLIKLFEKNDSEWLDELPIKIKSGKAVFEDDRETDIAYLKSKEFLNLNEYATAENCFDALVERYGLEGYGKKQARKIASVCYGMKKGFFSSQNPYTFAIEVPNEIVAIIKENSSFYVGVEVEIVSERSYVDGSIAPHIIGTIGAIDAEEYASLKDSGYGMNDIIGKTGIEKKFESYLKGTDGKKIVTVDTDGNRKTEYTESPVQGNAVILTIDYDTQKVAQESLDWLVNDKLAGTRSYQLVGSVVVQEVATGDVLAMASYPTFNLETYKDDVVELNKNELAPLWNRALQSVYTPGSTIKLAVAMAGLEEGIISDKSYEVRCTGRYNYYTDYRPKCLHVHGSQNVVEAIYNSCNIFFYEVSRLLGIQRLNDYMTMFGLGTATGVELYENEGNLDSIASREEKGEQWTPGLTLQAGIGHGNNEFTPMQLCSYVSTVANKGTRLSSHLVKSVMTADFANTVYETEGRILSQADFSETHWNLVKEGMREVGDTYFKDAVVPVCAKTGTTTVNKVVNGKSQESNNGIVVCYAPADDPQIAISIVIEGASGGASTAALAVKIINQYFSTSESVDMRQEYGNLS